MDLYCSGVYLTQLDQKVETPSKLLKKVFGVLPILKKMTEPNRKTRNVGKKPINDAILYSTFLIYWADKKTDVPIVRKRPKQVDLLR